jgi:hypothetical protein
MRFAEPGAPALAAASAIAAAAGSAAGVAWAIAETQADEGVARLVIGVREGEPAERAASAARIAAAASRDGVTFDSLGGAAELEATIQARTAPSHEAVSALAMAAVAKLRAAGVEAGCVGCIDGDRPVPRYDIDYGAALRAGASADDIGFVLAALAPHGTWISFGTRVVVAGADAADPHALSALHVAAAGALVPLDTFVRMTITPAHASLTRGAFPAALVWARAATEADARAALTAAVPAGTPIGPRRAWPD